MREKQFKGQWNGRRMIQSVKGKLWGGGRHGRGGEREGAPWVRRERERKGRIHAGDRKEEEINGGRVREGKGSKEKFEDVGGCYE